MIRVTRYAPANAGVWNRFVGEAKNGVFLLDRGYMDYHADRFTDHSLLFWEEEALVGLLPANAVERTLTSHGGLTYGGLLVDRRARASMVLAMFAALRAYMAEAGFDALIYKAVPHIYHQIPAEEDLYALTVNGAELIRRDISSTIDLQDRPKYAKGRKWSTKRALSNGLEVAESPHIDGFMAMEAAHLQEKYGVAPTHSGAEMALLAGRFPANIRLFTATKDGALAGGVLVYQSAMAAHAQYISSTAQGQELGALDAVMHHLLETVFPGVVRYFDFGISTEQAGTVLNTGLIENKESYGARATVHDFYRLRPA